MAWGDLRESEGRREEGDDTIRIVAERTGGRASHDSIPRVPGTAVVLSQWHNNNGFSSLIVG